MKNIYISVAMTKNRVIGHNNQLPWHLPADLKRFKQLTLNKTIIMGRKTFESIGHALPSRENIVITHKQDFTAKHCIITNSLKEAISRSSNDEVFIIGGQSIYEQSISLVKKLFITEIDAEINGDAFFPKFDSSKWKESFREKHHDNKIAYDFVIYDKL